MRINDGRGQRSTPLVNALTELDEFLKSIQEARRHAELGEPLPSEQVKGRLNELDRWLDDLTQMLGNRNRKQTT
jgi:hypothetical protein